jgi:glutamyl-tRNA reductase
MQQILLTGINHKTAPVELRECIALDVDETAAALEYFRSRPEVSELVVISTCNRVELLMTADDIKAAEQAAHQYLVETKAIQAAQLEMATYTHVGDEAVRHLFRVAASLDSMMVGEPQILGQVKKAYLAATEHKTSGVLLNRLLHRAFFVAKRVRTETGIGDHAVSISYAAVELGRKIFGDLTGRKVLLIGAGEMAELAVEHLNQHQVGTIFVANRTFENGLRLAQTFRGQAIYIDEVDDYLTKVDVIIASAGGSDFLVTPKQMKRILKKRRHRPLFFIDIAVPRNVDPAINRLENVYVYDIDDLTAVVDENVADRQREAVKGERIVEEAIIHFRQWYDSLSVVPTIVALRQKVEQIVDQEIERTLNGLEGQPGLDREIFNRMKQALTKKMLHDPTLFLKSDGCRADRTQYVDLVRRLFNLDVPPQ